MADGLVGSNWSWFCTTFPELLQLIAVRGPGLGLSGSWSCNFYLASLDIAKALLDQIEACEP
jgi:hypothetical protein